MGKELEFEPAEQVEFKGAFSDPATAEVSVKNDTGKRMAFKVKCSDNDLFKIRPVMGLIKEGENAKVTLTFTAKEKGKAPKDPHHFSLYQFEPKEDQKSARKLWEDAEAKKAKRHKKIKVVFTEGAAEEKKDGDKKEEKKEEGEKKEEEKKEEGEKKEEEKKEEGEKKEEEKKEEEKKE